MATLFAERRGYPAKVEAVSDPADQDGAQRERRPAARPPMPSWPAPTFEEWLNAT